MAGDLFDTCTWLAVTFPKHPGHAAAVNALKRTTATDPAIFCRATQISLLRLTTTAVIQKQYASVRITNQSAWVALEGLLRLSNVRMSDEPSGTFDRWRTLAALKTASPKVWMDAYLAAFAIAGGYRMVTLDADFRNFTPSGLTLDVIS